MAWTRDDHNGVVYEGDRSWGDVDKTRIPWVGHANWHGLDKDKKTTWRWPHHTVIGGGELDDMGVYRGGTLRLHPGGMTAFMSYAAQGDTEVDPQSLEHGRAHLVDDLGRDPGRYEALNSLLAAARGDITLNADELADVVGEVSDLLGLDHAPPVASQQCLHAARLNGEASRWVQIAKTGTWRGHPQRDVEDVGKAELQSALRAFERHYEAHGNPMVVDYHHQSSVAKLRSGPSAPAAGWIHDMELRNDGTELWAQVEWTEDAEHAISQRKYRYLSPVFRWNKPDRVTGETVPLQIVSVGLTNTPFFTSMEALHDELAGATDGAGFSAREGESLSQSKEANMSLIATIAEAAGEKADEVAHALGLEAGEDAEDEDVAEAVLHHAEAEPEPETVEVLPDDLVHELGLEDGSGVEHAVKAVRKLQLDTIGESVRSKLGLDEGADEKAVLHAIDELQEERQEQDAEALVEHAVESGKLPPSKKETMLRIAKRDLEGARDLINDMAQQVEQAQDRGGQVEHSTPLTEEDKAVCEQMGIDEEDYLAAKKGA